MSAGPSFTTTVQSLTDNIGRAYHQTTDAAEALIAKTPLKNIAKKVNNFVKNYSNLFFWTAHFVNAWTSPFSFFVGLSTGLSCRLGYRMGLINLNIKPITSDNSKCKYALFSGISVLFFKTVLRGLISGYIAGNYVGNLPVSKQLEDRLQQMGRDVAIMVPQ